MKEKDPDKKAITEIKFTVGDCELVVEYVNIPTKYQGKFVSGRYKFMITHKSKKDEPLAVIIDEDKAKKVAGFILGIYL